MSSFVIDKIEFVKAAGLLAGIEEASRHNYGGSRLWVYDYQRDTEMRGKGFYDVFIDLFDMNCISVAEQYHKEPWTDSKKYTNVFKEYKNKGVQYVLNGGMKKVVFELRHFFGMIEYQIEKQSYSFKAKMILNEILVSLMSFLYADEIESGSTLKL